MKKILILITILAIIVLAGCKTTEKTPDINVNVQPSTKTSPIGLWSVEKVYLYNDTIKQFVELPMELSEGIVFYKEYTKDGKYCNAWMGDGSTDCTNYDTYTINDDIIIENVKVCEGNISEGAVWEMCQEPGWTGPEWHYKWKVDNGKLELTAEMLDNNTNQWIPFAKDILKPASR